MRTLDAILGGLVGILGRPGTDTSWSRFTSAAEAIAEVEALRGRVKDGDAAAVRQAWLLFAPTGALQEIAMASGWHDEYIRLADEVDAIIGSL